MPTWSNTRPRLPPLRRTEELAKQLGQPLRPVLGRERPRVLDQLETRARHQLREAAAVLDGEEPVVGRPGDERRPRERADAVRRLLHVALPCRAQDAPQ